MAETVNDYNETDLGNVAPNPLGDYSETGEYEYLDLVAYAGGSYLCIKEDGTISGTAPTPGKTTEIWQEVSRPGDLTPEYVAMHDDVVNKAASVAEDAAQVAQNAAQVEGMKENVAALQEQTAQDALLTKEYRESAAGYAAAAETSRTAAGESEENIRALVNGFDAHVEEQKTSAQEEITTSRQAAIKAIAAQQVSSVNTVKQEGQKAIDKTNADAEETAADRAAVSEMAATVDGQAAQVAQNAAQVAEDKVTAENYMQTAGESKKQALEAAERLKDSVNLVQKNTVDLQGKAPVIIGQVTSYDGTPVEVNDSAEMPLQGLRLYGKSKQLVTTGKNLSSIKSCQLSTNMVSSDIVPWTKKDRIYFSCDTENVDGLKIYVKCIYYNESKIRVGANGTILLADGTRKEAIFSGSEAGSSSTNVDLATVEYISVKVGLPSSAVQTSFIDNIMLCDEANQTYEPYTGGLPSPSPEYPQEIESVGGDGEIGVSVTGKNLWIHGDCSSDRYVEKEVNLQPGAYTISFDAESEGETENLIFGVLTKDYGWVTSYYIQRGKGVTLTFVVESGFKIGYLRVYSENTSAGSIGKKITIKNVMLNHGSELETYEIGKRVASIISTPNGLPGIPVPFNTAGITYTDAAGQAWIADEIDLERGKYVQRVWKGEFDGSGDERWSAYSRGNGWMCSNGLPENMSSRKGFCNEKKVGIASEDKVQFGGKPIASLYIFYTNSKYFDTSLSDYGLSNWKAHLAERPLKVMTYLDTPIETDLTQEQLQAYKSLTTFKQTSNISNDAGAKMEVEYAADTKAYIDNKLQEIAQALVESASEAE